MLIFFIIYVMLVLPLAVVAFLSITSYGETVKVLINGIPDIVGNGEYDIFVAYSEDNKYQSIIRKPYIANQEGIFQTQIPSKYIDTYVFIRFMCPCFIHSMFPVKVSQLGVYATLHFVVDNFFLDKGKCDQIKRLNYNEIYMKAHDEMQYKFRNSRYKSPWMYIVFVYLLMLSTALPIIIMGTPGILIGIILDAVIYFLSPYSSGIKSSF